MPYNVYVIELNQKVANVKRFNSRNPEMKPGAKYFYVGQTALTHRERFERHKAGHKANRYVNKYGKWLRWKMFEKYNPISTRKEAKAIEKELALKLQAKGFGIWWG